MKELGKLIKAESTRAHAVDPTTASVEAANTERERLGTEVDRLKKIGDTSFVEGYDQAVDEIRDHFKKAQQTDVVAEIEKIWMKDKRS